MITRRLSLSLIAALMTAAASWGQSFFDDITYDSKKDTPKVAAPAPAASYAPADTYTVSGSRAISVDDYNRRGVFAVDSTALASDTTATDFTYTRRIERFYNPEVVKLVGDSELAEIYFTEPSTVNIYVNTPTGYWGYDYFYPGWSMAASSWYYSPWRWNSSWYWGSWYDPYYAWWSPGWGYTPGWAYGPGWGWRPSWGYTWGWGPGHYWGHNHYWGAGYTRPVNNFNPRHPGSGSSTRPGGSTAYPGGGHRPGISGGGTVTSGGYYPGGTGGSRPGIGSGTGTVTTPSVVRPGATGGTRPGVSTGTSSGSSYRPSTGTSTSRPSSTGSSYRPSTGSGGGRSAGSFSGGSSRGGSGGGRSGGSAGGGRGRH